MNKFIFLYGLVASTIMGWIFSGDFTVTAITLSFFTIFVLISKLDSLETS